MTTPSTLLSYVHDELPTVPRLTAERAVMDAVREFCSRSTVWREELAPIATQAGSTRYTAAMPAQAEFVALVSAKLDGKAVGALVTRGEQVDISRAPSAAGTLVLEVALRPERSAQEFPDFLAARYGVEIAAGAKRNLVTMRGQSWSAPDAAGGYNAVFIAGASQARREVEFGGVGQSAVELRNWV
jgi:hypothetical protein